LNRTYFRTIKSHVTLKKKICFLYGIKKKQFKKIETENKIILTTEKDGVRLAKFETELKDLPVFVFPVKHKIMFGEEELFEERIKKFIGSYHSTQNN